MDKQLLNALNKTSDAIEALAEALQSKEKATSATANSLKSGNFGESLKEINTSLKSIKKDTQEIIKMNKTILSMSKKTEKKEEKPEDKMPTDPKKTNEIKKGVGTILLIAGAVLAIGLALKIVGKVDFISVIALGLAITLIAGAFVKVAELKLDIKQALITSTALVLMSIAITISSWILSKIAPISFTQALTGILISAMFAVISINLPKLVNSIKGLTIKDALMLTFVLPAIAAGITISSWILSNITPIGFSQAITGILISAMFVVISMNLPKLVKSIKNINIKDVIMLVLVLPAISAGITVSSWILKNITPIGFSQAITGILIATMFAVVSINLPRLAKAIKNIGPKEALMITLVLPAISAAITASSWILSAVKPIGFSQFITALGISVIFIAISFAVSLIVKKISKMKWSDVVKIPILFTLLSASIVAASHLLSMMKPIPYGEMLRLIVFSISISISLVVLALAGWVIMKLLKDVSSVTKASLSIILLSGAIAAASKIIGMGNYNVYPGWKWSLFTGLSLAVFGVVGWLLMKLGGVGTYIKGSLALLVIAGAILVISKIISKGEYTIFPGIKWALGVSAALGLIGVLAGVVGLLVFGPQALIFGAGLLALMAIAGTILGISQILAKGQYSLPGFVGWAMGVTLLMGTFAPLILVLGAVAAASAVIGFFTGANPFEMGKAAFVSIAETIVEVSFILKKGTYTGGPTVAWARGVSLALGAFMPVYGMLMANSVMKIFGGGVGPEDFKSAIITVSSGIITAAQYFAMNKVAFQNGPPIEWARGVGKAIGAFAPVFKVLQEGKGWFGDSGMEDVQNMKKAIMAISEGIVTAAYFFAKNSAPFKEGSYPDPKWGKGVGRALSAFLPVFKALSETSWYSSGDKTIKNLKKGITEVSKAVVDAGIIFLTGTSKNAGLWDSKNVPDAKWGKGVAGAISAFSQVFELMAAGSGLFTSQGEVAEDLAKGITIIAGAIASSGKALAKAGAGAFNSFPSSQWGLGIKASVNAYLEIFDILDKKKLSPENFSKSSKVLEMGLSSMARTAQAMFIANKYMTQKFDPNFVKKMGKIGLDYIATAAKMMRESEKLKVSIGDEKKDPIVKVANGMITLANAYDRLAAGLERYAKAILLMRAVTGKGPGSEKGVQKTRSGGQGGPPSLQTPGSNDDEAKSPFGSQITKKSTNLTPLEKDVKVIINHLKMLTSDEPDNPGLMRVMVNRQTESNNNLTSMLEELESMNRKLKKMAG